MRRAFWVIVIVAGAPGCGNEVSLGARCARRSECPSPLVCSDGRCRTECERNADCPLGAQCRLDDGVPPVGTCELADEDRCPAAPCAGGDVCIDSVCRDTCVRDADCAEGNRCVLGEDGVAFCALLPSGGLDAGVRLDAWSGDDAGALDAAEPSADSGDGGTSEPDAAHLDAGADVVDGGPCRGLRCDAILAVDMSERHVCAIRADGSIWCWGRNTSGEVAGTPSLAECDAEGCVLVPAPVSRVRGMRAEAIAVGGGYSCALLEGGSVQCWGSARPGPDAAGGALPELVRMRGAGNLSGARAIAGGRGHLLIAMPDGLYGLGESTYGELGDLESTLEARRVSGVSESPSVFEAGAFFSCAVLSGVVQCWGQNDSRQLGRDTPDASIGTPAPIVELTGIVEQLALGAEHACGLRDDGTVACWGQGVRDATGSLDPVTEIIELDGRSARARSDLAPERDRVHVRAHGDDAVRAPVLGALIHARGSSTGSRSAPDGRHPRERAR